MITWRIFWVRELAFPQIIGCLWKIKIPQEILIVHEDYETPKKYEKLMKLINSLIGTARL